MRPRNYTHAKIEVVRHETPEPLPTVWDADEATPDLAVLYSGEYLTPDPVPVQGRPRRTAHPRVLFPGLLHTDEVMRTIQELDQDEEDARLDEEMDALELSVCHVCGGPLGDGEQHHHLHCCSRLMVDLSVFLDAVNHNERWRMLCGDHYLVYHMKRDGHMEMIENIHDKVQDLDGAIRGVREGIMDGSVRGVMSSIHPVVAWLREVNF